MYKSSLRHIHDPELLPLKVEVIFDMVYFSVCLKCLGKLHIDMSANTRVDHHTLMFHLSVGGLLYKWCVESSGPVTKVRRCNVIVRHNHTEISNFAGGNLKQFSSFLSALLHTAQVDAYVHLTNKKNLTSNPNLPMDCHPTITPILPSADYPLHGNCV